MSSVDWEPRNNNQNGSNVVNSVTCQGSSGSLLLGPPPTTTWDWRDFTSASNSKEEPSRRRAKQRRPRQYSSGSFVPLSPQIEKAANGGPAASAFSHTSSPPGKSPGWTPAMEMQGNIPQE